MIISEEDILSSLKKFYLAIPEKEDTFQQAQWPKVFPIMHMSCHKYRLREFGSLLVAHFKEPFQQEMICSFSPWEGNDVPYLMVRCQSFQNREAAYIEYFDHTGKNPDLKRLQKLAAQYKYVADCAKDDSWYEKKMTSYSLGKTGDAGVLQKMVKNSIGIYAGSSYAAGKDKRNIKGLKNLRREMKENGISLTERTVKMVGNESYRDFLYKDLLPVNEKGE